MSREQLYQNKHNTDIYLVTHIADSEELFLFKVEDGSDVEYLVTIDQMLEIRNEIDLVGEL